MQDANENVVALVNTSGSVAERYSYLPFGVVTVMDSSWSTISSSAYGFELPVPGHAAGLGVGTVRDDQPLVQRDRGPVAVE